VGSTGGNGANTSKLSLSLMRSMLSEEHGNTSLKLVRKLSRRFYLLPHY
jgi:hypothetical protein